MPGGLWAIVLAGGEGSRLRAVARDERGTCAPKQFCPLGGFRPPLAAAIERAEALVPRERVIISVIEAHRPWWSAQLAGRGSETIVSQPLPRGTATGILLPLLAILERDPGARVLILPADHAVEEEDILRRAIERASWVAGQRPDAPVLLGITPTSADGDLGWVVPAGAPDADSHRVEAFVEKPGPEVARQLMAAGGMWYAFLVATNGRALMRLFERHLPELYAPLRALPRPWTPGERRPIETFESLPSRDFSRDLLTPAATGLRMVRVPACGWTDLGTPARLFEWLASQRVPLAAVGSGFA
jgi:mannose-1-phosphate guanylyltransferase